MPEGHGFRKELKNTAVFNGLADGLAFLMDSDSGIYKYTIKYDGLSSEFYKPRDI